MNKITGPSLVSTLTSTLPKAKVKTVAKTLQDLEAEPLLDIMAATLLKVVAKAFADTHKFDWRSRYQSKRKLTRLQYCRLTQISTHQTKLYLTLLLYGSSHVSTSAGQKRCLHTDMQQEIEFETRESRSVGRDIR